MMFGSNIIDTKEHSIIMVEHQITLKNNNNKKRK